MALVRVLVMRSLDEIASCARYLITAGLFACVAGLFYMYSRSLLPVY
jgi:hypothetical protein